MKNAVSRLYNHFGAQVTTRPKVELFFATHFSEKFKEHIIPSFDWTGIDFIGRSAAHQWLMETGRLNSRGVEVNDLNQEQGIIKMFDIVSRTRYASAPPPQNIPVIDMTKETDPMKIF